MLKMREKEEYRNRNRNKAINILNIILNKSMNVAKFKNNFTC